MTFLNPSTAWSPLKKSVTQHDYERYAAGMVQHTPGPHRSLTPTQL